MPDSGWRGVLRCSRLSARWFMAAVVALLVIGCTLPITEPPDVEPRIQNQTEEAIEIFQFPFESPESLSLLRHLDPWEVHVFDAGCTDMGLLALASGVEIARIDNGYGLCSNDVWKVRGPDSIVGDDGRTDSRP